MEIIDGTCHNYLCKRANLLRAEIEKKKKTIFMMNLKLLAKQTHNLEKDFDFNL